MATYMSGVKHYDPAEWVLWYGRCYGSNLAPIIGTGPAGHFEDWADVINLGSAVDLPVKAFDRFTKDSPIADRFANAKIEERYCCSVKAFTPIATPIKEMRYYRDLLRLWKCRSGLYGCCPLYGYLYVRCERI